MLQVLRPPEEIIILKYVVRSNSNRACSVLLSTGNLATTAELLSSSGWEPRICFSTRSTTNLCVRNAYSAARQNLTRCYLRSVGSRHLRRTRAVADAWLAWRVCACAAAQKVCLDVLLISCVQPTDGILVELCACIF